MDMVVRLDMVAMDLHQGKIGYTTIICRMQRGGRVLKFTESDFTMKSWIIQEDLTRDFQKPEDVHYTPQDVCNGSKPPK